MFGCSYHEPIVEEKLKTMVTGQGVNVFYLHEQNTADLWTENALRPIVRWVQCRLGGLLRKVDDYG